MADKNLEFVRNHEQKIQRRFKKTHELLETKIDSTLEAVIASFNESTYVTKSKKLLHESSTDKEIDEFLRNVTGLGSEHMRDMDRLYKQLSVMRFALEKAFNSYSDELERVLKDFEQNIVECDIYDEKACTELEKKMEIIEKENWAKLKKVWLERRYGDQMQEILEEMRIKKES